MKRTTTRIMVAMTATLITGSVFAQVDSTKTDTTVTATDPTVVDTTQAAPTEDKKPDTKDTTTAPQAFISPASLQSNTYVLVATNREMVNSKKNQVKDIEKKEA